MDIDKDEQLHEFLVFIDWEGFCKAVSYRLVAKYPSHVNLLHLNLSTKPVVMNIDMSSFFDIAWTVWRLSQSIMYVPCSGSKVTSLKNHFPQRSCFAASERARSSASVVDVVTAACFFADQSIEPPNSRKNESSRATSVIVVGKGSVARSYEGVNISVVVESNR